MFESVNTNTDIRVTEEDRLSETAVWPTLFLLNVSTALKETHNYILFITRTPVRLVFYKLTL